MRGRGPDVQLAAGFADVIQVFERPQIHEMLGRGKAQLHHGDEAHAPGEGLGAAGEQVQGFIERFGSGVFKFLGDHVRCSSQFFVASNFQIFSGVSGMSMWRTPSGESASTTELTTAGEQPMVPASPTPLTPSGFTGEGVHVWWLSIHGIMWERGTA